MTAGGDLTRLLDSEVSSYLETARIYNGTSPLSIFKCALECANEGGEMIRKAIHSRGPNGPKSIHTKVSAADLVTETDIAVEQAIRSRINGTFPDHLFVGEEGTNGTPVTVEEREGKLVWIVDPIDGTTNFVHGFSVVAVSIAVAYGDELIMGVVYNPLMNELWFAWKGCGAFMRHFNGVVSPIHTAHTQVIDNALISTGFCVSRFRKETKTALQEQKQLLEILENNIRVLMTRSRDIRRIGSAACDLCYVAMGRTDAFFEFGVKEWDIAAGLVILHEAGGVSSTVGGKQPYCIRGQNILVASTEALRVNLSGLLMDKNAVDLIEVIEK